MKLLDLRVISAAVLVILLIGGFSFFDISELSLASGQDNTLTQDVEGASFDLYTSSTWTPYADYPDTFNFYGDQVKIENHANPSGDDTDVGTVHIGGESQAVDLDGSFQHDGVKVSVTRGVDTVLYDGYPYSQEYDNYIALGGDVTVTIPKESIKADINDFHMEKTGGGQRRVLFNVSLTNDWNRLAVDEVRVEAFEKNHVLPVGPYLDKGTNEYSVSGSFSEYDISQYQVNKTVNKSIRVHVDNPRIPADEKSFTGAKSIENPDFGFSDFKTETAWFTADIKYCGEAAEWVDGVCVIDEDLHLRGDTCFLPENYTIVTETFEPGTYDRNDVAPDPSYFCSRHPTIVTNDGVQTDRITSPYQKLVDDKSFSVPEGQTYTMFWVVNANEVEVNRVCEEGTLNKTTGDCVVTPSVVHRCSSGVWSPEAGSCVVTPSTQTVCEKGRYNKELGVCVFNPEVEERCPAGSTMGEGGMCYSQASVKKVCPENVNGTLSGGRCVTDATLVVRDSPWSSFRVFVLDLQNWFEDRI
ncbi:hypothetical protein [Natrinema sp. H-ect4]|uniref:hypothetical protein n=1 Tax=Natrinema sp. H-ect4 TaxID=3242699 RepID=UPI0035A8185A